MTQRQFFLAAAGIVLIAYALRDWYIIASVLPHPTQGDVSGYLRYALHLTWDGTFSQADNGQPVTPDAYRNPGYPLFLAGVLQLSSLRGWYHAVFEAQAIVGALTVAGVIILAQQWLARGWALLTGGLLAIQPHHIVATNAMLLEVIFGFSIVVALLLTSLTLSRRSMGWSIGAGIAFGSAYLINPVIALFPAALLVVFWRARALKVGAMILLFSMVAVAGWGIRNSIQHANADGRAWINLVQGSWPDFHHSEKWWTHDLADRAVHFGVQSEVQTILADHVVGLRQIASRISGSPVTYLAWYTLEKPYLLWAWNIRIGHGGIYTLDVLNSPLDRGPLLALKVLERGLNPFLFVLMCGFSIWTLWRGYPGSIAALFAFYITAVHVVFQAEPRYAIAYRPIEMLLASGGLAMLWNTARRLSARPSSRVRADLHKSEHE